MGRESALNGNGTPPRLPGRVFRHLRLQQGGAARNALTLLSGTVIAQLLGILFMIPCARLYMPSQLGLYALFQSVVAFGVSIAALRYDVAIILPTSPLEARVLRRLAGVAVVLTSVVIAVVCVAMRRVLVDVYGSDALGTWIPLAGLAVFVVGQATIIQYWLTRSKEFRRIAQNRVLAAGAVGSLQLGGYFLFNDVRGLMLGFVAGQLLAIGVIVLRTPGLGGRLPDGAPSVLAMAARYKKMPLLNGPNALVDSVRTAGISFMIGSIAVSGLGHYSLAWQFTMAPGNLIQSAIGQVLLQRMSVAERGELGSLVRRALARIAAVSIPIFSVYYWCAPAFFGLVFGPEWADSGSLARALIPWVFMVTFTAPLSNVFIVSEKQQWLLLFAVVYTLCPLLLLGLSGGGLLTAVTQLGWMMCALLAVMVVMAVLVSRRFDAGA